jgi:iron-sulfur cluster repair protein YtfE (RIC family)
MTAPTDLLRQEHRQIRSRLASIRALADRVDDMPVAHVERELEQSLAFLERGLLPHALGEDAVIYPVVGRVLGDLRSTATMSRDHLEIVRLVDQLAHLARRCTEPATRRVRRDLRRTLYAIDAVVSLHVDKEEELYLPLLEAELGSEAVEQLIAQLARAAHASSSSVS